MKLAQLILLALTLSSIPLADNKMMTVTKGPLHFTGQTPLQTMRLDVVPTRYRLLEPGQSEISLFNSLTNRWNATDNYFLDIETVQNILSFTTGVREEVELGIEFPFISISGGHLDHIIGNFHNTFGLGQAGRNLYPYNSLQVSFINEGGLKEVILSDRDRGTMLGDIGVFMRSRLYRGKGFFKTVILTTLVRFPTSSNRQLYGTGGTDGAVSLSSMQNLGWLYLYTTLGYGVYGRGSMGGISLKSHQWTFFAAAEYPVSRKFSLIAQQLTNSGVAQNFYEFSESTYELTLGVKHRLRNNLMLEYGIIENLFSFRNSTDFGLIFGLVWQP